MKNPPAITTSVVGGLLLVLGLLTSCTRDATRAQAIGTYRLHDSAADTLTLRDDGTYTYQHRAADSRDVTLSSKWTFEMVSDEANVVLADLSLQGSSGRGFFLLRAKVRGNDRRLRVNEDGDRYFKRL